MHLGLLAQYKFSVDTYTSRPAKLRTSDRPKIQNDLPYHDTVNIVKNKRNVQLFQSPWMILNKPVRELFHLFCNAHPMNEVS